jgi:hypothetical protein
MRSITVTCPECLGGGTAAAGSPSCRRCGGSGEVRDFDLIFGAPRRRSIAADAGHQAMANVGARPLLETTPESQQRRADATITEIRNRPDYAQLACRADRPLTVASEAQPS